MKIVDCPTSMLLSDWTRTLISSAAFFCQTHLQCDLHKSVNGMAELKRGEGIVGHTEWGLCGG